MFLEVRELFCTSYLEIPVFEIGKEGSETFEPPTGGLGSASTALTALEVEIGSNAFLFSTAGKTTI